MSGDLERPLSPTMASASGSNTAGPGKFVFDGKRMRKAVVRRTIDFNTSIIQMLTKETYSVFKKRFYEYDAIHPDPSYVINMLPPSCYAHNYSYSVATKFIHASTNKIRCPVNVVKWTPEGRRLITGSQSGEFTLWNGLTFNFETITQAHEQAVRTMTWSHNGNFLISGDHIGTIKYWQPNLNNVQLFQAHKDPIRDLTFSPTDAKFASCSDDGTIKVWDFFESKEESVLMGHNWDVKNVQWHPISSLLASGSKDNTVRLWDPRTSTSLATIHGHKNTVLDLKWNPNGKWLLTAGKDQLIKIYDIRKLIELQSYKGHKKDVTGNFYLADIKGRRIQLSRVICPVALTWHPFHENVFVSGSYEGSIHFWHVMQDTPLSMIESAHEQAIWSLDWHPVGHVLVSGSNDHSTRFWTRCRPADSTEEDRDSKSAHTRAVSGHARATNAKSQEDDLEEEILPGFGKSDEYFKSESQFNPLLNHYFASPPASSRPPPPPKLSSHTGSNDHAHETYGYHSAARRTESRRATDAKRGRRA